MNVLAKCDDKPRTLFKIEIENKVQPNENCRCKYCEKTTIGWCADIIYEGVEGIEYLGEKYLCSICEKLSVKNITCNAFKKAWIKFRVKTGFPNFLDPYGCINGEDYYLLTGENKHHI